MSDDDSDYHELRQRIAVAARRVDAAKDELTSALTELAIATILCHLVPSGLMELPKPARKRPVGRPKRVDTVDGG